MVKEMEKYLNGSISTELAQDLAPGLDHLIRDTKEHSSGNILETKYRGYEMLRKASICFKTTSEQT